MSDAEAWRKELLAHKRRLALLKEQAALQGISSDPRIELEIEDIQQKIAVLEQSLGQSPSAAQSPVELAPSFQGMPVSAGGDAIIAHISSSSKVAVGKHISQIDHAGGPTDRTLIDQGLIALSAGFERLRDQLDPAQAGMAAFQISLLRAELNKADDAVPSANTIIMVVDWLRTNIPQLDASLKALLAVPAVARTIG